MCEKPRHLASDVIFRRTLLNTELHVNNTFRLQVIALVKRLAPVSYCLVSCFEPPVIHAGEKMPADKPPAVQIEWLDSEGPLGAFKESGLTLLSGMFR